jgi:hypothetical protein
MRLALAVGVMLLSSLPAFAGRAGSIDSDTDDLVGVWKLQSFSLQIIGEQPQEVFGRHPLG